MILSLTFGKYLKPCCINNYLNGDSVHETSVSIFFYDFGVTTATTKLQRGLGRLPRPSSRQALFWPRDSAHSAILRSQRTLLVQGFSSGGSQFFGVRLVVSSGLLWASLLCNVTLFGVTIFSRDWMFGGFISGCISSSAFSSSSLCSLIA